MAIGIAAVVIFILYLIDKNKQWRAAGKVIVALGLTALALVGVFAFERYQTREADKANAAKQAAIAAAAADGRAKVEASRRKSCEEIGGVYHAGRYPDWTCTTK